MAVGDVERVSEPRSVVDMQDNNNDYTELLNKNVEDMCEACFVTLASGGHVRRLPL
jgi:hypothetical protein